MHPRWKLLAYASLLPAKALATGTSPTDPCLKALSGALDTIGAPAAGEVASERSEIADVHEKLFRRGQDLHQELVALGEDQWKLDFDSRDLHGKSRQIDVEQTSINSESADLGPRIESHNADAMQQHMAAYAGNDAAGAWGERVESRKSILDRAVRSLEQRQRALDERRNAIATEAIGLASRSTVFDRNRNRINGDAGSVISECAAALSRARALIQIRNTVARNSSGASYQPPKDLADTALKDAAEAFGKTGALMALESKSGRDLFTKAYRELAEKAGVKFGTKVGAKYIAATAGIGFTMVDLGLDVGLAGVDQRTQEVERNLLLIGDYGAAMKVMVDKDKNALHDPDYQAMRAELERKASGMPGSTAAVALQGMGTSAAVSEAFFSIAKDFVAGKVGRLAGRSANRLNNAQRKSLGPGGVVAFRSVQTVKAEAMTDAMLTAGRKALSGQSHPAPVPQTTAIAHPRIEEAAK